MTVNNFSRLSAILLFAFFPALSGTAGLRIVENVTADISLHASDDMHITSGENAIASGALIDLSDPDCRLYFDNIKPSDVMSLYGQNITVNGAPLDIDNNAKIRVYRHGAEIVPHDSEYTPLEAFSEKDFKGESETYIPGFFYSPNPAKFVRKKSKRDLALDNKIKSFILRRGYMATFATNPDGSGYSRCFIAEDEDLEMSQLPNELNGNVSFVRVFPWNKTSKKGWVGGNSQTNPPEGYLDDQADATRSTWVYSWGTNADWCVSPDAKGQPWRNQEYVMEKWGHGGDSDWKYIDNEMTATHLLSYNEPDHGEQSNVSVEQAIAEWPRHLESGLRLGSPATTDFSWLYRFIDECDKRNYRVDFVAIHAYWGGSGSSVQVASVDDWKRKLTEIHERTGRPIWITEWNNGANWTHEAWPSDKKDQQEKQRKFMEDILAMFDECDFIERYSVYNWVEEKRSLFWGNLNLTPAGEVYRDFDAAPAFSKSKEYVPTWDISCYTPTRSINYDGDRHFKLEWTDEAYEFYDGYIIEESVNDFGFYEIARTDKGILDFTADIPESLPYGSNVRFRVLPFVDGNSAKASNEVSYGTLANSPGNVLVGRKVVGKGLVPYVFPKDFASEPVIVAGTQSYRMKAPMLTSARYIDNNVCKFGPASWSYNDTDSFVSLDTLSYMVFPTPGAYDFGGIKGYAGKAHEISSELTRISFPTPFASVPAVFATVVSGNSKVPVVAAVSNISAEGFDVKLIHESAYKGLLENESVDYLAVETGTGTIGDRELTVGVISSAEMGTTAKSCLEIDYGRDIEDACFFSSMLSECDDITSALRATSVSGSKASIFRNCELSGSETASYSGDLAWAVIAGNSSTGVAEILDDNAPALIYDHSSASIRRSDFAPLGNISIFSLSGALIMSASDVVALFTESLPNGFYIAKSSNCDNTIKFFK